MEPPYFYVREKSAPAAHHWDYLRDRSTSALCGHEYVDPITLGEIPRPRSVCRGCQARLCEWETIWWRDQYHTASSELGELRLKYDELKKHSANQRKKLSELHRLRAQEVKKKKPRKTSAQEPREPALKVHQRKQKARSSKTVVARPSPSGSRFAKELGIPVITKDQLAQESEQQLARKKSVMDARQSRRSGGRTGVRAVPETKKPKTAAEKASDEAARERMRSHKPSSWRLGRSPGSYG